MFHLLLVFISLLILGILLIFFGIKAKTAKKQEFEACIINLNGTRKLYELNDMRKIEANSIPKIREINNEISLP